VLTPDSIGKTAEHLERLKEMGVHHAILAVTLRTWPTPGPLLESFAAHLIELRPRELPQPSPCQFARHLPTGVPNPARRRSAFEKFGATRFDVQLRAV